LIARVRGDGTVPEVLAEHFEADGFRLPMTIALVDQDNKSIRGEITAKGEKVWH
jgi:hypothetical protein